MFDDSGRNYELKLGARTFPTRRNGGASCQLQDSWASREIRTVANPAQLGTHKDFREREVALSGKIQVSPLKLLVKVRCA
jgi:hypothetical protein